MTISISPWRSFAPEWVFAAEGSLSHSLYCIWRKKGGKVLENDESGRCGEHSLCLGAQHNSVNERRGRGCDGNGEAHISTSHKFVLRRILLFRDCWIKFSECTKQRQHRGQRSLSIFPFFWIQIVQFALGDYSEGPILHTFSVLWHEK